MVIEDTVFVTLFILLPTIIFFFYRVAGLSFRYISIPNAVVVSLFVFSYIGILPLYFHWDEYRYKIGVVDRNIIFYMYLASSWAILSITSIFIFLGRFAPVPKRRLPEMAGFRSFRKPEFLICIFVFGICLLFFISYVKAVDQVALMVALFGEDDGVAAARSSMTNAFRGNYHWYRLLISDISVFVSYCFFAHHLKVKVKPSFFLFWISFFLCCIFLLSTSEKAPVIWYFLGLFLVYAVVNNSGFVSMKGLLYSFLTGLAGLVVLYIGFMGVDNFSTAITSIFSRAFAAGISASYFYFEFFPHHKDFLWGSSLPNPGGLLPFEPYSLTKEIMAWRFPGNAEKGVVGSSPTVFWGEAYANFSLGGVLVVPVLIGLIIYLYHYMVSFLENTPFKVALVVWLVLFFRNVATTGFSTFFINITLFSFLFIVIVMIVFSNRLIFRFVR